MIPSNHTKAEEFAIKAVENGQIEVREDGSVWRLKARIGGKTPSLKPVTPERIDRITPGGYRVVKVMINRKRVSCLAHRLVWRVLVGVIPDGLTINHKDGVKDNNMPPNLETSTYSDQQKHNYKIGLASQSGERNAAAKLTQIQVDQIREIYAAGGVSQSEVGMRFGVAYQTVSKIVRGDRWNPPEQLKAREFPTISA